jgi:hypothetical protein
MDFRSSAENSRSHDAQRYLELLDQRTGTLGALADTLAAARQHIIGLDVDGLEARIAEQESLCRQLLALDRQLDHLRERCTSRARSENARAGDDHDLREFAGRLADARERMQGAQARVKALNESHRVLLRRCRRTTSALRNSYATFAGTYRDPSRAAAFPPAHAAEHPPYGVLDCMPNRLPLCVPDCAPGSLARKAPGGR